MRVDLVTIFPEYFAPLELSLIGRARRTGLLDVAVHDLREHAHDRHRTVDGPPAGGGAGMVMRPEPWAAALDAVVAAGRAAGRTDLPHLLVPSPAGAVLTQAMAAELATAPWLAFACGRYEGIDERVVEAAVPDGRAAATTPVSLGDYVLGGGEVAALAVVEAVARLLPGVVGNPDSLVEESHSAGLLEHPVYTRPGSWGGREVPAVLTSGDHGAVARWRRDQALARTASRRPDLVAALDPASLDERDRAVLAEHAAVAHWSAAGTAPASGGERP